MTESFVECGSKGCADQRAHCLAYCEGAAGELGQQLES